MVVPESTDKHGVSFFFLQGAMQGAMALTQPEELITFSPIATAKRCLVRHLTARSPVEIITGCPCQRRAHEVVVAGKRSRIISNLDYKDGRYSVAIVSHDRRQVIGFIITGDRKAAPPTDDRSIWYEVTAEQILHYASGEWVWRFSARTPTSCPNCEESEADESFFQLPLSPALDDEAWCPGCGSSQVIETAYCQACSPRCKRRRQLEFDWLEVTVQ